MLYKKKTIIQYSFYIEALAQHFLLWKKNWMKWIERTLSYLNLAHSNKQIFQIFDLKIKKTIYLKKFFFSFKEIKFAKLKLTNHYLHNFFHVYH